MEIKYGFTSFNLQLPQEKITNVITAKLFLPVNTSLELISDSLKSCRDAISLFLPTDKVTIVTSDITRYSGSELYLPMLVERLNRQGIPDKSITILIALGIHRKQTPMEHKSIIGSLYGRIKVLDHDCDDLDNLVSVGKTSNGIDVSLNRLAVEANRLILTGVIGFHYFAGFGGGRKSILPGIASRKACMASHFAVLNPEPYGGKNSLAATAVLDGNPVNQAMLEACDMIKPDFIINTVVSPQKQIMALFSGDWREAHERGCRYYQEQFSCQISRKTELIIVSCGGFPKDINLIQAHKSMEYASYALKDNGVMILLAACIDGLGHPTFFDWFKHPDLRELEARLRANYEINGQTAYSIRQKTERFQIILVSELPQEQVAKMNMIPVKSLEEAIKRAEQILPSRWDCMVVPDGGSVLPLLISE